MNSAHSANEQHLKIYPLAECGHLYQEEIGEMTRELGKLNADGVPIPAAWVIPTSFLLKVAEFNGFFAKVQHTFQLTNWSNPLSQLQAAEALSSAVRQFTLPESLHKVFLKSYTQWMEEKFVAVRPSFVHCSVRHLHLSDLNIKGEVNLAESLFWVWAKLYRAEYLEQRRKEWLEGNLIPAAFVIQEMIQGDSSGVGKYHPSSSKSPSKIEIYAAWGVNANWEEVCQHGDKFEVDPKDWQITNKTIQLKELQWTRHLDRLERTAVPKKQQNQPALTDEGVLTLAQRIYQINKQRFTPVLVDWAAEKSQLYILDVRDEEQQKPKNYTALFASHSETPSQDPATLSAKLLHGPKVLVSIARAENATGKDLSGLHESDGVGLLKSEFVLSQLPAHPQVLIQQGKMELIRKTLSELIIHFAEQKKSQTLLYRSQNFTSNELSHLPQGKLAEHPEPNPYLGYRGALRILRDYHLFDIELDALIEAHHHTQAKLGMMVPFIRSSSELGILLHHFKKPEFANHTFLEFWMQCSTPENIYNIEKYCQAGVTGFCLNMRTLHCLLHGIDPDNPDILQLYPINVSLMQGMLRELKKRVDTVSASNSSEASENSPIKLHIYLESFHPELVETAVILGFDAITVRPQDVNKTKTHILSLEH